MLNWTLGGDVIFGKIEYLNLLPFHVFMKRFMPSNQQSQSMNYKAGIPSEVNKKFLFRRVDAAFISSISAKKYQYVNLGIIAKKEVWSVLVIPQECNEKDMASASSNILANILDVQGKVLIGDKALKYYLTSRKKIDLAQVWTQKYNLPFVFAVLCFHNQKNTYKSIQKQFLKQRVKIPQYILKEASRRTEINSQDILEYLKLISYDLDLKAKKGLKKFYLLSK